MPENALEPQNDMPEIQELSVNDTIIGTAEIRAETASHTDDADPDGAARRALVVRELLTQRAHAKGLLAPDAEIDDDVIDRLLAMECTTPLPSEEECRRYYTANTAKFSSPDIIFVRHILFALPPGAAMASIRARAEQSLRELRQHPDRFEALAASQSNCPSGQIGGNLGQLSRGESVPEFEAAVFSGTHTGVLPDLVKTRYGFHIVCVERRIDGEPLPFESAHKSIERFLCEYVRHKSIQQYLTLLASGAELHGITLDVRAGPLLQ